MYVVPTPFRLMDGVAHTQTLILPADKEMGLKFECVGDLQRKEAEQLVVAYSFDLRTNDLVPTRVVNPDAGKIHQFRAWRLKRTPGAAVAMKEGTSNVS